MHASEVLLLDASSSSNHPPSRDDPLAYSRDRGEGSGPELPRAGKRIRSARGGFSTVIGDGRPCSTGTPETAARNKDALFPNEGGPAILEVSVPDWIMAILYADSIAAGLARSGEIRFEAQSGLDELRAEWPKLPKRVILL